jgi:hypothetical protein
MLYIVNVLSFYYYCNNKGRWFSERKKIALPSRRFWSKLILEYSQALPVLSHPPGGSQKCVHHMEILLQMKSVGKILKWPTDTTQENPSLSYPHYVRYLRFKFILSSKIWQMGRPKTIPKKLWIKGHTQPSKMSPCWMRKYLQITYLIRV